MPLQSGRRRTREITVVDTMGQLVHTNHVRYTMRTSRSRRRKKESELCRHLSDTHICAHSRCKTQSTRIANASCTTTANVSDKICTHQSFQFGRISRIFLCREIDRRLTRDFLSILISNPWDFYYQKILKNKLTSILADISISGEDDVSRMQYLVFKDALTIT